ncbi:MAG: hypothetical protein K9K67_10675 [Bacteriovoracaceae bacterium]|nr:hypothetical protein [Bacteriovoracaceae bacterium]
MLLFKRNVSQLKFFFIILLVFKGFSTFATNEFQLGASGRIIIAADNTPVQNIQEATQLLNRLNAIRTSVLIPNSFSPHLRDIVRSLREDINGLRRNQLQEDTATLNRIRNGLRALSAPISAGTNGLTGPSEFTSLLSRALERTGSNPQLSYLRFNAVDQMRELSSKEGIPKYCENYPSIDREDLEGYYGHAEDGEGLICYQINQSLVGLDLSTIGDSLLSIEEGLYERKDESLKKDLILTATAGVLRESAAYAGLFEGTDPDLSLLRGCAAGGQLTRGERVNPPNQELLGLIDAHVSNLDNRVEGLEKQFTDSGLNRKDTFLKEHIKQALIVGNLYDIKINGEKENNRRIYRQGRLADTTCRERLQRESNLIYADPLSVSTIAQTVCPNLIGVGKSFENFSRCRDHIVRNSQDTELRQQFSQCLESQSQTAIYNVSGILPVMAKKLDEFPILFNREDNSNLIPFTESESQFVPSEFSKKVASLPGASDISLAIKNLLLEGVEDPEKAIEDLLKRPDLKERLDAVVNAGMQEQDISKSIQDEVKDYRRQITRSAQEICENNGDYLHQFPELVNEAIARRLNEPGLGPSDKQRILAQSQASQCHLLQMHPPDEEGGIPVALQVIGIAGAIGLGLLPGVGTALAAVAIGTLVGVSDGVDRNLTAGDRLAATEAAFTAGFASSEQVLDAAGNLTDSRLTLGSEVLLAGGEGLSLIARGVRSLNAANDVARTPASTPPSSAIPEVDSRRVITEPEAPPARIADAPSELNLRARRITGLRTDPGSPTLASEYNVISSVGNIDTSEELLRFKEAFNDDVLNRLGLDGLQNYDNPAELQSFRDIYQEFLEPGRGFFVDGKINDELLKKLAQARCTVSLGLRTAAEHEVAIKRGGRCHGNALEAFQLTQDELQELATLGAKWDEKRELFGAQRIALADQRSEQLKRELQELSLDPNNIKEVECETVSKLSRGFASSGKNCFAFNTRDQKDDMRGAFCSCGSGNASNWMIRCPKTDNEFLRNSNYYDQIALFKNESLNCFRVDIPDNVTCFAGPAGPRRGGLGGMAQIFCPNRYNGDFNLRNLESYDTKEAIELQVQDAWRELSSGPRGGRNSLPEDWKLQQNGPGTQFPGGRPGVSFKERVVGWSPNPQSPEGINLVDRIRPCASSRFSSGCSNETTDQVREELISFFRENTTYTQINREVQVDGNWIVRTHMEPSPRAGSDITQEEIDGIRRYGCQFLGNSLTAGPPLSCGNGSPITEAVDVGPKPNSVGED